MNNIQISGRLGHDVSLRYKTDETAVGRFSIAVGRGKKDGQDLGTDWFECVAFGNRAETINRYFHKGDWIEISGRVKIEKYIDKEGVARKSFDVIVKEFHFGGGQREAKPEQTEPEPVPHFATADEDIPF